MVNTVSPGYARESLTREFGSGGTAAARQGIGMSASARLDTIVWNPATDSAWRDLRPETYPAKRPAGRPLKRLGFVRLRFGRPRMIAGRSQKGIDMLADAAPPSSGRCGLAVRARRPEDRGGPRSSPRAADVVPYQRFDRAMARRSSRRRLFPDLTLEPCGTAADLAPLREHAISPPKSAVADSGATRSAPGEGTGFARCRDAVPGRGMRGGEAMRGEDCMDGPRRARTGGRLRLADGFRAALRGDVRAGDRPEAWPSLIPARTHAGMARFGHPSPGRPDRNVP